MTRAGARRPGLRVVVGLAACIGFAATAIGPAGAARPSARSPARAPAFTATALNSYSAQLTWTLPPGAATVKILRNGRLIDAFPAASAPYVDYLLWQSTTYSYELDVYDAGGGLLSSQTTGVTTPAQSGSFPRFYAADSFWNTKIKRHAKVDADSKAIIAKSVLPYVSVSHVTDTDAWGIPLAYSGADSENYAVGCTKYGCNIDVHFRIPRYARQNSGTDGKLVVVDPSTNTELDMGRASYDPVSDAWTTESRYTTPSDGWGAMCGLGQHCDGVLMSGIDQFGGIIRPEEIAQGHIDHALALAIPYWRDAKFVCPAVKSSGHGYDDTAALPEGAHLQLSPKLDVDAQTWPAWEKVVARAMQRYGAYVVDAGSGAFEMRAEANLDRGYDAWSLVGMTSNPPPKLTNFPWSKVRVLKLSWC
jgi:hypothetical protein